MMVITTRFLFWGAQVSRKMGGIAESVASGSEGVVQRLLLASKATTKTIEVYTHLRLGDIGGNREA